MSADPLDKQLVEAVLSRPRRAKADLEEAKMAGLRPSRPKAGVAVAGDDDDDDDDDDLDLGPRRAEDGADVGIVVVAEDGAADPAAKLPVGRAGQARPEGGRGALRRGARGHLGRHDRDRRPGPDVPQGDRQGRPADRRGRGRPGQGHRARRADGRGAVEGRSSRSTSGPSTTPSARRARRRPSTACRSARRRTTSSAARWPTRARRAARRRRPTSTSSRPGAMPSPTGRRSGSRRPRSSSTPTTRRSSPEDFHAAPRLGVPRRPQRRPRLARQHRAAGDLGLDARGRGVPGARALDPRRQRRGPAQADGLRPGGAAQHQAARPQGRRSSSSAATRASS